jgi:hypothetical protein
MHARESLLIMTGRPTVGILDKSSSRSTFGVCGETMFKTYAGKSPTISAVSEEEVENPFITNVDFRAF